MSNLAQNCNATRNRFHVHLHVADLASNITFYSQLFGAPPSVAKADYAKWMLEDPRINFAISTGKSKETGIAHLGLQAHSPEGLLAVGERLKAANAVSLTETGTTCCYARSDKFWAVDPQGVRWETFHTSGEATTYYAHDEGVAIERDTCCGPASSSEPTGKACASSCSIPAEQQVPAGACCG
jgi:catechol 2,3-dioxygenase-like lactoylglutathione lyase family enzyme